MQKIDKTKDKAENDFKDWGNDVSCTYYLKLHGSLDYSYKEKPLFIAGENKSGHIESCPLTKFYSEIFEKFLKEHDCKLIIIDYGFKDEHINKIIFNFLKNLLTSMRFISLIT